LWKGFCRPEDRRLDEKLPLVQLGSPLPPERLATTRRGPQASLNEQHARSGLIEIADQCDTDCPVCCADPRDNGPISFEGYRNRLDTLERVAGTILLEKRIASAAIADGTFFLRADTHLYRIEGN
jgi:uncharacterized radical SAM superfamily Fe-S cluster-containing enzyme